MRGRREEPRRLEGDKGGQKKKKKSSGKDNRGRVAGWKRRGVNGGAARETDSGGTLR